MFLIPFPPVDAGARKGAMLVLWKRELVKGSVHLSDAVKIGALIGTGVPTKGVSYIAIDENIRKVVALLFPDIPACADAHCRQTPLQRGRPYIAVQMHAEDKSCFINQFVCTGRVYCLSAQAGQKVLVWLSEAWLLVDCLDLLPAF